MARTVGVVLSGCGFMDGAEIHDAVVGIRSRVQPGARITNTVLMGADFYEDSVQRAANAAARFCSELTT